MVRGFGKMSFLQGIIWLGKYILKYHLARECDNNWHKKTISGILFVKAFPSLQHIQTVAMPKIKIFIIHLLFQLK